VIQVMTTIKKSVLGRIEALKEQNSDLNEVLMLEQMSKHMEESSMMEII
jgi:hypothetical protein